MEMIKAAVKEAVVTGTFTIADSLHKIGDEQIEVAIQEAKAGDFTDAKFTLKLGQAINKVSQKIDTFAWDIMMDGRESNL